MGRCNRMKPFKKRVFYDGQEYMIECTQSTIHTILHCLQGVFQVH